ncbi:hypothetical protein BP6252_02792 [Coleophoma cylindrospora]|uniref:Uncharacterized protein n=1 Tax=Coleophoma cylindrospora TaxID=1849047 RepID=A0A3D8SFW2_9HELO|nr:hypothetical protein BP6252_02792 [Coleophoma cylindrospora]
MTLPLAPPPPPPPSPPSPSASLLPPPPPLPPLRSPSFEANVLEILRKQSVSLAKMEKSLELLVSDSQESLTFQRNTLEGLQLVTTDLTRPPDENNTAVDRIERTRLSGFAN